MAQINRQNGHNMAGTSGAYRLPNPQEAVTVTFEALATTGNTINGIKDHKTIILIQNTAAAEGTVTFLKGDGLAGVNNFVVTVPASGIKFVAIESAKFADKYTGEIKVNASATTMKMAVLEVR